MYHNKQMKLWFLNLVKNVFTAILKLIKSPWSACE